MQLVLVTVSPRSGFKAINFRKSHYLHPVLCCLLINLWLLLFLIDPRVNPSRVRNSSENSLDYYVRADLEAALNITGVPSNLDPALGVGYLSFFHVLPDGTCDVPLLISGDTESNRVMLLIGDSHAAHWQPAFDIIAKKRGFKLHLAWFSLCPPIWIPERSFPECDSMLNHQRAIFQQEKPEVIIGSHLYWYLPTNYLASITTGYKALAAAASAVNASLVILGDTPHSGPGLGTQDGDHCLAAHIDSVQDCTFDRNEEHREIAKAWISIEQQAAQNNNFTYIDSTDMFCTETRCPAVVNNLRVLIDVNHVTPPYMKYLVPHLDKMLDDLGVFK